MATPAGSSSSAAAGVARPVPEDPSAPAPPGASQGPAPPGALGEPPAAPLPLPPPPPPPPLPLPPPTGPAGAPGGGGPAPPAGMPGGPPTAPQQPSPAAPASAQQQQQQPAPLPPPPPPPQAAPPPPLASAPPSGPTAAAAPPAPPPHPGQEDYSFLPLVHDVIKCMDKDSQDVHQVLNELRTKFLEMRKLVKSLQGIGVSPEQQQLQLQNLREQVKTKSELLQKYKSLCMFEIPKE